MHPPHFLQADRHKPPLTGAGFVIVTAPRADRNEKEIAMTDISSTSVPASQNSAGEPATSGPHVASMSTTVVQPRGTTGLVRVGPRLGPPNSASEIQATTRA